MLQKRAEWQSKNDVFVIHLQNNFAGIGIVNKKNEGVTPGLDCALCPAITTAPFVELDPYKEVFLWLNQQ